MTRPTEVGGQRVSGLRFGDPVVLAVMTALLMFRLLPEGFSNRDLRQKVAQSLVRPSATAGLPSRAVRPSAKSCLLPSPVTLAAYP